MLSMDPVYLCRYISMIQQMKRFHSTTCINTLPAIHLARTTQTTSTIPLITQLFNLWQECLTMNLSDRPTNILSYKIHQQFTTHTIFQLYVESLLTVNVPRELVEVPHENFIVQPSWLFHCHYQLKPNAETCVFIYAISFSSYLFYLPCPLCFSFISNLS